MPLATSVFEFIGAWIKWLSWLGVGAGACAFAAGLCMTAMGRNAEDPHLARRGVGVAVTGFAAAALSGSASVLARWLWPLTGGGRSPGHGNASDDGSPWLTGMLLWGGLGLGGLALAALGGWGVWRLRGRRAAKRRRWKALEREHEAVAAAYGHYLGDVLEWLDRPTLNDVGVSQTAALVEALAAADDARRSEDVDRYQRTVAALSTAWKAADDHARKAGLRHLEPAERRTVEQARKLLATALDSSGSEHERRSAYAKARDLLDGVLVVPPKAIEVLENKHRLALAPKTA
ncbi:DUF2786 domain-containing protein [Streptomyces sp. NPDC002787]